MKVDNSRKSGLASHIEERKKPASGDKLVGTVRVDIKHVEHLNFHAFDTDEPNSAIEVDEPVKRDGHGRGHSPLSYFLVGAGSCLLTQWAKIAVIEGLEIDNLDAIVRGHTDRRIDGRFTDFVFDVRMTGNETAEKVRLAAKEAERLCFVHNTLKLATPVVTNVSLNDKVVYTSKLGPETTS